MPPRFGKGVLTLVNHGKPVFRCLCLAVTLSLGLTLGCVPGAGLPTALAAAPGKRLSAVYVYDGSRAKYRDADAASIDQIFYSFALFRKGHVSVSHWKNLKAFQQYIRKHPQIQPILSIGGWGADGFSQAAATAETRATFVADTLALLAQYGFTGVDIDWEYPGSSVAGIESSPADRENYTLLLQALREGLDTLAAQDGIARRLCIALSGSPSLIPTLECARIGAIVDQVNLMTYDLQLPELASHHSALFASNPAALSADACVQAYLAAGIPAEKLMLGAAFYGHRWTTRLAEPLYQPAKKKDTLPYTSIAKLLRKTPAAAHFDTVAQAPYFADGKVFISYDDPQSIARKAADCDQNGLLGVFAWEYGGDTTGTLVAALRGN